MAEYLWSMVLALFVATATTTTSPDTVLNAKVWQSTPRGNEMSYNYPEIPDYVRPQSTAICFSGGGSRSYTASLGYMRALSDMGLMDNVRYITGVSGGSWASAVYTYSQHANDEEFLGDIVLPENITEDGLKQMSANCARKAPGAHSFDKIFFSKLLARGADGAWLAAVGEVFFEANGIDPSALFTHDALTLQDIRERNPALAGEKFLLPHANRPFLVISTSFLGPVSMTPFSREFRKYTMLEITSLYIGEPLAADYTFCKKNAGADDCRTNETWTVGGLVEPFAFGSRGLQPGTSGLQPGTRSGSVDVLWPANGFFTLGNATSSSSYAPAEVFDGITGLNSQGLQTEYWSPADPVPRARASMLGDGGNVQNPNVISMLQRRVENIVLFINFATPVSTTFDPSKHDQVTTDDIDSEIPPFFGIFPVSNKSDTGMFDIHNKVFKTSDFAPLVRRMQAAALAGDGIVVTQEMETVENLYWGIDAGIKSNVTWVYLGRATNWEARLSDEMQKLAVPAKDPEVPANTVGSGPFKDFPHYATTDLTLNYEQANLLADFTGWIVEKNADIFRAALPKY